MDISSQDIVFEGARPAWLAGWVLWVGLQADKVTHAPLSG